MDYATGNQLETVTGFAACQCLSFDRLSAFEGLMMPGDSCTRCLSHSGLLVFQYITQRTGKNSHSQELLNDVIKNAILSTLPRRGCSAVNGASRKASNLFMNQSIDSFIKGLSWATMAMSDGIK